jgi:hypothetical protein
VHRHPPFAKAAELIATFRKLEVLTFFARIESGNRRRRRLPGHRLRHVLLAYFEEENDGEGRLKGRRASVVGEKLQLKDVPAVTPLTKSQKPESVTYSLHVSMLYFSVAREAKSVGERS